MKRAYHYILILLLLAVVGCSKRVDVQFEVDETSPVPITLSASVANSVSSKAAIENWNDTEVHVYGLKRTERGYNYLDNTNIVDYKVRMAPGYSQLMNIYSDEAKTAPYFYTEGYVYDFFAYHISDAVVNKVDMNPDSYQMHLTFDGTQDLMCAAPDMTEDIKSSTRSDITFDLLYSSKSARANINPTLVFNHALTRFVFVAKGMGDKYHNVQIKSLKIASSNSGTMIFCRDSVSFVPDKAKQTDSLSLSKADDTEFEVVEVEPNTEGIPLGGKGASILAAPGMDTLSVVINLINKETGKGLDYTFTVDASEVRLSDSGNSYSSDVFEAGHQYNIIIYIYGPEKIIITSTVAKWLSGGSYDIDPDVDGEVPVEPDAPTTPPVGDGNVSVGDYNKGDHLGDYGN